jgi:hypothetical protein
MQHFETPLRRYARVLAVRPTGSQGAQATSVRAARSVAPAITIATTTHGIETIVVVLRVGSQSVGATAGASATGPYLAWLEHELRLVLELLKAPNAGSASKVHESLRRKVAHIVKPPSLHTIPEADGASIVLLHTGKLASHSALLTIHGTVHFRHDGFLFAEPELKKI